MREKQMRNENKPQQTALRLFSTRIHMLIATFSASGSITETLGLAFVPQSNLTIQNFQNHFSQNFAVLENLEKIFSESSRILLSTGTKTSLPDSVTRK